VYAGAVHEPYLQAFLPTPAVAGRLIAGAPFAPAVRQEGGPVWKVAVLGDPLYTLMDPVKRTEEPGLEGAVEVGTDLRELLTAGEFARAMDVLTLTGRDAQAAQLAASVLAEQPQKFTPQVARASVMALMRAGDNRRV